MTVGRFRMLVSYAIIIPLLMTKGYSRLSHIVDNVGNEQRFHYNEHHQLIHITGMW